MKEHLCNIVIADDHKIFRDGLKLLITTLSGIQVIGEAENGKVLRKVLSAVEPDIVVLDINMPMEDGISVSHYIRRKYPNIRIIAMTVYNDSYTIEKMFDAGAQGYLTKDVTRKEFDKAIREVMNGKRYITPEAENVYESNKHLLSDIHKFGNNAPIRLDDLSNRELEILKLIANGHTNKSIALKLDISPRTVETHRSRLLQKLKVNNTSELFYKLSKYNII
jgi:DNA-binding NarL/FixJ family response regulator